LHHAAQKVALVRNEQLLISNENAFSRQADPKKAFGSTNERKQMSTKTTLKRIALAAVSALGFGLMSVVSAPVANAAAVAPTTLTVGTILPARAGVNLVVPVTASFTTSGASDTLYLVAKVLSAPTGSVLAGASSNVNSAGAYLSVGASTNLTASVGANNPYLEFYGAITNPLEQAMPKLVNRSPWQQPRQVHQLTSLLSQMLLVLTPL
jgi:hypothetical protein